MNSVKNPSSSSSLLLCNLVFSFFFCTVQGQRRRYRERETGLGVEELVHPMPCASIMMPWVHELFGVAHSPCNLNLYISVQSDLHLLLVWILFALLHKFVTSLFVAVDVCVECVLRRQRGRIAAESLLGRCRGQPRRSVRKAGDRMELSRERCWRAGQSREIPRWWSHEELQLVRLSEHQFIWVGNEFPLGDKRDTSITLSCGSIEWSQHEKFFGRWSCRKLRDVMSRVYLAISRTSAFITEDG